MSVRLPLSAAPSLLGAALVSAVLSPAAVAGPPCAAGPCDAGHGAAGRRGAACRGTGRYTCRLKIDSEPIERECNLIEPEVICIPPIGSSPFDCLRDLLGGGSNRGELNHGECGADGCTAADGDGGAHCGGRGGHRGAVRKTGWFSKLTGVGCGKIRCVNSLGSHDYESGRRCTYEWDAVPVDACGRPLVDCDPGDAKDRPSAPGPKEEAPPPAPAPPTLEFDSANGGDDPPAAPTQQGVAQQAIER